jgi:hypothetical protein
LALLKCFGSGVAELMTAVSVVKVALVEGDGSALQCVVDGVVVLAELGGGIDISLVVGFDRGVADDVTVGDAVTIAIEVRVTIEMLAGSGGGGVSACRIVSGAAKVDNKEPRSSFETSNCESRNELVGFSAIVRGIRMF